MHVPAEWYNNVNISSVIIISGLVYLQKQKKIHQNHGEHGEHTSNALSALGYKAFKAVAGYLKYLMDELPPLLD